MPANTYAFDVTAADVVAEELNFPQQTNSNLLDNAIDRAASELNTALRMMRIVPSSITSSSAVDDYNWCRATVIVGAAGYYIGLSTGAWPAAQDRIGAMFDRIRAFREAPQMLQSYNPDASSASSARSRANHNPGQSLDTATRNASARFLQPNNQSRWRQ